MTILHVSKVFIKYRQHSGLNQQKLAMFTDVLLLIYANSVPIKTFAPALYGFSRNGLLQEPVLTVSTGTDAVLFSL